VKRKKEFYDPYVELIDRFNRQGISYVVVGMSGINYYASNTLETFSTQDFDIFVKPTIDNVKKSIAVFKELGYNLVPYKQPGEDWSIKDVVKNKKTILAVDSYGITFKLILSVSGFTFSQMEGNAVVFNVGNIPVKVSKLSQLLLSKKIAGRKKDKLFLKRYEMLLKEKDVNKKGKI
jgi:competence protein ComGF